MLTAARDAADDRGEAREVTVALPVGVGEAAAQRLALIDRADAMARDRRMIAIPVLRRDGTRSDVELAIHVLPLGSGRLAVRAELAPP